MRTLRAMMVTLVGVSLAPVTWASAPSLAHAFAHPPAPALSWLVDGEEEAKGEPALSPTPGPQGPDPDYALDALPETTTAVVAPVLDDSANLEGARLAYVRARRTYTTGMVTSLAGTVLFVPALYVTALGAFGQANDVATVGAIGMVVTAGAAFGGLVAANVGALNATSAAQYAYGAPIQRTASVAGLITFGVAVASTPFTLWVGPVVGVGGGLLGAILQMRQANDALHQVGLASYSVVPTANGLAVVGRF